MAKPVINYKGHMTENPADRAGAKIAGPGPAKPLYQFLGSATTEPDENQAALNASSSTKAPPSCGPSRHVSVDLYQRKGIGHKTEQPRSIGLDAKRHLRMDAHAASGSGSFHISQYAGRRNLVMPAAGALLAKLFNASRRPK